MTNTKNEIVWKPILLGEALLLQVLSRAIRNDPDRGWLQTLIQEEVFTESPLDVVSPEAEEGMGILQEWSVRNREGIPDDHFLELRADHTRLFIGPGKPIAPPWESVYFNEDRMIFQKQTVQVRNWFRRFGLEAEKVYQEPDDHIGLELSFLAALAKIGLEALEEKDEARFEELLQAQKDFLFEHPLQWVKTWSDLVVERAQTDYYRGLAKMIHGTLLALAATFDVKVPQESAR